MSLINLENRLRKVEAHRGRQNHLELLTDDELLTLIRSGYLGLEREHGSLAAAVDHLRGTGDSGDRALAILIGEDIGHAPAGSRS